MDTAQAYEWRLQNFVLEEHILKLCPENQTPVKVSFYRLTIPKFFITLILGQINFQYDDAFSTGIELERAGVR